MKLIVGLGNPGEKYKNNRHNVGFNFVETLANKPRWEYAKRWDAEILNVDDTILAKPQTYMNESGKAVKKIVDFYKIPTENLLVVYDDLDILLGSYKIVKGKSPRQHKGVESVEQMLGTKDFWHVRIGIEHKRSLPLCGRTQDKVHRGTGKEYVLEDFTEEERGVLNKVLAEVGQKLLDREGNG